MFRKAAFTLSTLAVVATLGAGLTSASAKPIKMPHPHHFGMGWGALGLLGAAAVIGTTVSERSNCYVAQQAVDGPYGPYIQNVTVCN